MRKSVLIAGFISLLAGSLKAQPVYEPFNQLKTYTATQKPGHFDSLQYNFTNILGKNIHYLYPLYQALGWEQRFKLFLGEKNFYSSLSPFIAMTGDYKMAMEYLEKSYDTLPAAIEDSIITQVNQLKGIQYVPAKNFITESAKNYKVVMINEAHCKPQHRAFLYSLLDDLYNEGYHYLAMETLNNYSNHSLDSLNINTGFYTNEPIAGELVRKALSLGFTLVSYEDTAFNEHHSPSQRDSIQAVNIYRVIKKDPSAKILVYAGYGHISESMIGDYTPMAKWFSLISGIDPFTIDQTEMTEISNFEYGRLFYDIFTSRFVITSPSVILKDKRFYNPFEETGYNILVVHPPTIYKYNRPTWLDMGGERKLVLIQPTEKTLFLVQAYYENEYSPEKINEIVPADQTYITADDGYYPLYLKPGKYKIVMRDAGYKILSIKDQEVTQ
ncbi:MAG: hypothetical protein JSU05_06930 [Bacteroidetes bacterium]|nr:hypothetical protein [Bacteroidota bacterium]